MAYYDPSQNPPVSSDLNTLQRVEYSRILGQKYSAGDRSISSIIVKKLIGDGLNINTPTGATVFRVDNTAITTGLPINTLPGQNLVINPSGPSVDFTGHTLINVGGIAQNPNYFPVVGDTIQTTNVTPVLGEVIPADPDSTYTLDASIALLSVAPSLNVGLTGSIFIQSRAKRIGGVLTITSLISIKKDLDPLIAACTAYFGTVPPVGPPPQTTTVILSAPYDIVVSVVGVAGYNIKWKVATTVTKQTFV